MFKFFSTGFVVEDTTSVVLEGIWNGNSAGNWSSLVDLIHHGLLTTDGGVFVDSVDVVFFWDKAFVGAVIAVSAYNIVGTLNSGIMSTSLVVGTSFISDVVLVHEIVSSDSVTSVASIIDHVAGQDNLRGDYDVWELSLSLDLDPVGEGRGGGEGPTGTAVGWDVLLSDGGKEIGTIDV